MCWGRSESSDSLQNVVVVVCWGRSRANRVLGKISQQIKVKFDLPYLNQHTHNAIVTPNYIFKVKFDLPYLNHHNHTAIITSDYVLNLLNQII